MSGWDLAPEVALRARHGSALEHIDCRSTPGWSAGKSEARQHMARRGRDMATLQEMLYAHGRTGGDRSVLLVLQGMDTSGKGGVVRHVIGMVDPQGVALRAFGVPTRQEAAQHYLWRIRRALPPAGHLGVFDRSHYEDVLVVRVDELVAPQEWQGRYEEINAFEQEVAANGTVLVKVLLAISPDEQAERLRRRLERPHKHWKYVPGDVDARSRWNDYIHAYQDVLDRTSTPVAPWYVVPADRKWYARLAVTELVAHALEGLDLSWPVADFDVAAERARLEATT